MSPEQQELQHELILMQSDWRLDDMPDCDHEPEQEMIEYQK